MKLQLIAIVLVSMLLVHETESWRIRIRLRRIGRAIGRVLKPACQLTCPRGCGAITGGIGCQFACRTLCGRRKREALSKELHVTGLPRNFDFYDLDDDTFVYLSEIAKTLGHQIDEEDLARAFDLSDKDRDGKLTEDELFTSDVFVFADDPEINEKQD